MAPTPEWWLDRLAAQMDARRGRLKRLRSYVNGNAPLPGANRKSQETYREFQRHARTNYAEIVVDSVANRLQLGTFRVGESEEDDDRARQIWNLSRANVWVGDVYKDMFTVGHGYMCVQEGEDGEPEIVYAPPEQCITDQDPRRTDRVRAALRVYRDDVQGSDFAFVHVRGAFGESGTVTRFSRPSTTSANGLEEPLRNAVGGWQRMGPTEPTGLTNVPFVPFINKDGAGEFEAHTDLLDRMNWVVLQRLIITAMQAFRQRGVKSGDGDWPTHDEDGNPIDYSNIFESRPDALWMLPEGADLWESQQTDIRDILESIKDDRRDFAAVTRTPLAELLPEGQNQSATGASFAKESAVMKAADRIERVRSSLAEVIRLALALDAGTVGDDIDVDVHYLPPDRPGMAERYDALTKAGADVPWRSKMTHILGFDGDTVDRMAIERAEDMALMAAFAPPEPGPSGQQEEPGGDEEDEPVTDE